MLLDWEMWILTGPLFSFLCKIWLRTVTVVCWMNPLGFFVLSIHMWRYSPFRALTSLIRRLHSSLFSAVLLQPLIPSSYNASLWTTSAHLVIGLPTGLVVLKFPFKTFFAILSSSILTMCPAHPNLLILILLISLYHMP